MRILFLGSGPFGIPTLQRLHSLRDDLIVATVPDAPFGRSHTPRPSIIKEQATSLGLEVLEAEQLRGRQGQQVLEDAAADLVITADIRLILGDRFLQGPKCGCYNLHGSLLPRWRGAAPVVRALLAGDEQIGVTLYKMVAQLDAGPVVAMESWTPPATVTTQQAEQHLSLLAAQLLERMLESLESGDPPQTPQQEEMVTRAPNVEKSAGWVSWESGAIFVERQVRAPGQVHRHLHEDLVHRHQRAAVPLHAAAIAQRLVQGLPQRDAGVLHGVVTPGLQVAGRGHRDVHQ